MRRCEPPGEWRKGEGARVKPSLFRQSGDDLPPENPLEVLDRSEAFDPLTSGPPGLIFGAMHPKRASLRPSPEFESSLSAIAQGAFVRTVLSSSFMASKGPVLHLMSSEWPHAH